MTYAFLMARLCSALFGTFAFQVSSTCDEQFVVPAIDGNGCIDYGQGNCIEHALPIFSHAMFTISALFPTAIDSLPAGPFVIDDAWPMPYFVTAPCKNVSKEQTNCTSFNSGDSAGTPAYAAAQTSKTSSVCYALGHLADLQSVQQIVSAKRHAGIEIL